MVNPGKELSSIDFESMIGGALIAVVNAQAQAALSTVNFIKAVGFKAGDSDDPEATNTGDPIYVTFKYPKEVAPYQPAVGDPDNPSELSPYKPAVLDDGGAEIEAVVGEPEYPDGRPEYAAAAPAQIQTMEIQVPILTMLPIPYIRIEETTIDFNAKINSMETREINTDFAINRSSQVKQRWPGGSVKLNMSTSYKRKTNQDSSVERTYSMIVHVKAVQDEMPGGMEKILGILEGAILAQPLSAPEPVEA